MKGPDLFRSVNMKGSRKRQKLGLLKDSFGKDPGELRNEKKEIALYYELTGTGGFDNTVDDITWNDLEMDEIFRRINHTGSYIGEQTLYRRLHILGGPDKEAERRINYYQKHETERLRLEYALSQIGKDESSYYLPLFLFQAGDLSVGRLWVYRLLQFLLLGSFLLAVLLDSIVFFVLFAVVAVGNLAVYSVKKAEYEAYLSALLSTKQMVSFAQMLVSDEEYREILHSERISRAAEELGGLTHLIGNFQIKKTSMWSGDVLDILRDYLMGTTLWDFTVFRKITNIITGKLSLLLELYEFIGQMDMEIGIASFRESLPVWCSPVFGEKFFMKELYHPLLLKPVGNDLNLEDSLMITGSNASGKSTFIKAVAVNAILGMSIHTCAAKTASMPYMGVMTSMTVRDDLSGGESYYIRGLSYLKRMLDSVDNGRQTLCVIDEILRGTNTQERLAASKAVLKYLAEKNCTVIVATHDRDLALALKEKYRCMYFSNYIEDGSLRFDYKIHEGCTETTNAILLLESMNFPQSVVEEAKRQVR